MTRNETEQLLQRFMDGLTTHDEERRLRQLLAAPDSPHEWDIYRLMLSPMPAPEELLPQAEADAEYWSVVSKRRRPVRRMAWAVAASVAIVLCIVGWMRVNRPAMESQGMERQVTKQQRSVGTEPPAEETSVRPDVRLDEAVMPEPLLAEATDNVDNLDNDDIIDISETTSPTITLDDIAPDPTFVAMTRNSNSLRSRGENASVISQRSLLITPTPCARAERTSIFKLKNNGTDDPTPCARAERTSVRP